MLIVLTDDAELRHLSKALARYVNTFGDAAPASFATIVESISRRSAPSATTTVDRSAGGPQTVLVSYTEAAAMLDCHTTTIGRYVAAGRLDKVGRRITSASLQALVTPSSGRPPCTGKA